MLSLVGFFKFLKFAGLKRLFWWLYTGAGSDYYWYIAAMYVSDFYLKKKKKRRVRLLKDLICFGQLAADS